MRTIKLQIDGIATEAEDRTPLLAIAQKLGISIPTLCYHPIVEAYGVCRICTVEVRHGRRVRMVTACNYPATDGIEVLTSSPRVRRDRRMILEWLLARCGHVKVLEDLWGEYGGGEEPRFGRGDDDCILCGLCVRVCQDVVGANVLDFFGRGTTREVSTAFGETDPRCIACGACAYVCPTGAIQIENDQELVRQALHLGPLTPISIPFMQAVPHQPVIDADSCIHFKTGGCKVCEKVCEVKAIDHAQQDRVEELEVGAVILATGFAPFDPTPVHPYGYGKYSNVITGPEFERMNNAGGPTGGRIVLANGREPTSVGILHCVGSRDEHFNRYCSRVCCMYALKFAHLIKEKTGAEVYNFYIDMRCAGKGYEEFYHRLLEEDVRFVRGRAASVSDFPLNEREVGKLVIRVEDTLIGQVRRIPVDMVVLCTALQPQVDAAEVARMFNISCAGGFFMERHPKLAPVSTPTDGIFIAGCCQGPKDIPDTVAQASGAAAQSMVLMSRGEIEVEAATSWVDEAKCAGCRICNTLCSMSAITFDEDKKVSSINDVLCKGCGTCAAACPSAAIVARHFTDEQVFAEIEGVLYDVRA
ncbi:MAG: 4Fe-4S dicluster domain-containing protein [Acidobacteriota bacterium]